MFTLTIETGNEAMATIFDVAEAVARVANRMHNLEDETGFIMDHNGNKVGEFILQLDDENS